ncbi:MAG TPA: terminase TerL endonuclease subunit [Gammaproteobacteria bacterium]
MGAAKQIAAVDVGRLWLDRAYQYAADVKSGEILSCRYVKLAVDRFYRDLQDGHKRGLYFDENSAARYFRFVSRYCRHYQGELAGKPIDFSPHQCFIEANVYGWLRADGTRRFRSTYEEVARKDGKTTRLGASGLYGLIGEGEAGAKIYSAATKREQAKELFLSAKAMVEQSPELRRRLSAMQHHIQTPNGLSLFMPLSADSTTMDGLNVYYGLVDEIHAHTTSAVWDVLESAKGARRQPLMRGITTAGFNRKGFGYQQRGYAIKILERAVEDDSFFAIIYTLDDEDLEHWDNPDLWIKANPNLGISVKLDDLLDQSRKAKEMPSAKVEFLTKRLNIWTFGETLWMNMERWHLCASDFDSLLPWDDNSEAELDGCEAYGGLDLASVDDMASFRLVFPLEDGRRLTIGRAYLPQAALERRLKSGDKTLIAFRDSGHLVVTPGNTIDYEWIKRDIFHACERFDVKGIAFDRWNSSQLVNDLISEEIPMIKFGQGHASMSAPMKELMRLVLDQKLQFNDPLLTWAISNVVANTSPAGDIKPDKSKVSEKIDPAVALIMAIGLAMGVSDDDGDLDDFISDPIII